MGKENALTYHKTILDRFTIQNFARKEIEILDLGTQVLETGTFTFQLTSKSTGKQQMLVWQVSESLGRDRKMGIYP